MRCQLPICMTSCYTVCHLFGKIHQNKAPAPLLTSRNEGNVLSVPPLETHGMVLWVICHCWQVFYAALSRPIAPCSPTHTRQCCNTHVVLRLLFGAKAFQAPFEEILSMQWPQKMMPREMGMCPRWIDPLCFCCLFWSEEFSLTGDS